MMTAENGHVFLKYSFRIRPEKAAAFQEWAGQYGTKFWERCDGIVRYETFRTIPPEGLWRYLGGKPDAIHGWSCVEAVSREALEAVMRTSDFRTIQEAFLEFVEPASVRHCFCACVYRYAGEPTPV